MPLEIAPAGPWPPPLAGRVDAGADARQLAHAVAGLWRDIDAALHPVIGHRGVAALFNRSVRLASRGHPWLAATAQQGGLGAIDPAALVAVLSQQPSAAAAAGGLALLHEFHALLTSLVGPSLTDRLLAAIWGQTAGGEPTQDQSP